MTSALIQPQMLVWARKRADFAVEELAKKLGIKDSERILSWEQGNEKPTFKQAQKVAQVLHIPFGYLYLDSPPVEKPVIPDLRTVGDKTTRSYSMDLNEVIADVQRKMEWYKDYLQEIGAERLDFAGKFSVKNGYLEISKSIVETLKLKISDRREAANWESFFNILVERSEQAGIIVLRSGKVGNNTHRTLDVKEFRGFAIYDELAPFIFINGVDAKAAQIFTLIHELAHIWLGASGVSNNGLDAIGSRMNSIEKLCNDIAAEVLVPATDLLERWKKETDFVQQVEKLSSFYKVSTVVIARRLFDLEIIEKDAYWNYYQLQASRWNKNKITQKSSGNYYLTLPVNNGKTFTKAVLYSVFSNKTLFRDGARLLGMKPANLSTLADKMGL